MKKWIISTAVTIGILTVGTIPVFAGNNHGDTSYTFNFTPGLTGSYKYTDIRPKYDYSSAYMMAKTRSKSQNYSACVVDSNGKYFSQTWYVEITKLNKGYYIANNAYEDKGKNVKVKIKGTTGDMFGFKVTGVWSPDSV
ncbi:hypothetical protein [Lactococcus allomyrinae]|uniref:DUF2712 domain-containing protein n=1 Tax=Lactococcus allomyrinae TaxID=2419773 RepID=A0A387BB80_9LACT|nr:hypothetical protein [Lactococcus allomyrinae]AYG01125.1 hypothetical protein D7I46_08480 [Lactococcus allomyrinae]